MSGGTTSQCIRRILSFEKAKPKNHDEPPYNLDEAKRFKAKVHKPLMLVGASAPWNGKKKYQGIATISPFAAPNTEPGLIIRWGPGIRQVYLYIGIMRFNPALKARVSAVPLRIVPIIEIFSVS